MAEMRELVTVEQAERVIAVFALSLPGAGLVVGGLMGAARRRFAQGALVGVVCGLCGPLVWVLWRAYNAVVDRFGLDSVVGLVVNLALFLAAGAAIGLGIAGVWRRARQAAERVSAVAPKTSNKH